jgi:hypothetical protein
MRRHQLVCLVPTHLAANVESLFWKNLANVGTVETTYNFEHMLYIVLCDRVNIDAMRTEHPGRIAPYPVGCMKDKSQ